MRLYQSVYETAMRNQIPRPIIDELIRHAKARGDVWFATHAEVVQWAKAHAA